ncbi:MAG TPA: divergent polysaccharide deacetylase family protein [Candidatus Cybelea sp.]|nr:divergent polysaccharide deacetylase family protein [Candidatus Cybelea sp.]
MPRKSKRRRGSPAGQSVALVALVLLAAFAGWQLLRPASHHYQRHVAGIVTPEASETPSEEATEEPSEEPPAVIEPSAAPTEGSSESPLEATAAPSPEPSVTSSPLSPAQENRNGPQLALIVDDCGQWLQTERGFVALNVPVTLSVLPHVRYGDLISREAAAAGKGVMLHLPMETLSGMNPGPGKITTEMSDAQIVAQVQDDLAQVPLANGVNNHEGSKASADERVMRDVLGVLSKHGLFFIDSRTNAASVGEATAREMGIPTAARNVFLDNRADVAYSEAQLLEAAKIARETGSAIAIGHPKPTTLAAVQALLPQLEASGIHFVLAQQLTGAGDR